MYMRTVPLIKLSNLWERNIYIAYHRTSDGIYACILPHACWKSPEKARLAYIICLTYCFSFCQWAQRLTSLLVFSNSDVLFLFLGRCPFPSLSWVIKSSLGNSITYVNREWSDAYHKIIILDNTTILLRSLSWLKSILRRSYHTI